MFVLLKHLCFVEVVVVDVLVVFDDVDVVEIDGRDLEEVLLDDVVNVVDVVVVVVSQPLQVLAQSAMLATRLSHKSCILNTKHWLFDNVSLFPAHGFTSKVLTAEVNRDVVDVTVVLLTVSQPLHVLSHPTGSISVSQRPSKKIFWHNGKGNVFLLFMHVFPVAVVLVVLVIVAVDLIAVVLLVLVLAEVVYVVVLVLELVDVEVLVVVVSHPLHVLSH